MSELPVRNCLACGQRDNHPRDVHTLPDHSSVEYHVDCHARMTPPCESCLAQTETAPKGATGDAMREHLTSDALREHLTANYPHLLGLES